MKMLQVYDCITVEMEEVRDIFDQALICDVPLVSDMLEQVGKFRGKMLRPVLVLLCGKACGQIRHEHRVIAAVTEMVHMATLVHDDVLDEAEYRRRGRTINALHGNEAAVILGDLLISQAFHLCSSLDSQLASRLIGATTNTVCEGELMQLYYRGYYNLTEERYLDIIARKTASLIGICCYLGARAAHTDDHTCRSFETFGTNLGMAFQIMDDVTDLIGTEAAAGKTLRSDLVKEKTTLPVIHFLRTCSPKENQWARQLLTEQRKQDYPEFVDRLHKTGSIDYARQRAEEFVAQAKQALPNMPDEDTQNILLELASLVIA